MLTAQERQHAADAAEVLERFCKSLDRTASRKPAPMWLVVSLIVCGLGGFCALTTWALLNSKTGSNAPYIFLFGPMSSLMTGVRERIIEQLRPELDELHQLRFAAPFSEIEVEMKSLLGVYPASAVASIFVTIFLFVLLVGGLIVNIVMGFLPQAMLVYFLGFLVLLALSLLERGRLRKLHNWITGVRCKCGYDLAGNAAGRCPECGVRIPIAAVRELQRN